MKGRREMIHTADKPVRMLVIADQVCGHANRVCVTGAADALRQVRVANAWAVLIQVDDVEAVDACVEVLEELRRRRPHLALVVLSSRADDQVERSARAGGAHCYVHGDIDLIPLGDLLARIARRAGTPPISPAADRPPEARANGPPRRIPCDAGNRRPVQPSPK